MKTPLKIASTRAKLFTAALILALSVFFPLANSYNASAAALEMTMVRFDRMKISEQTTGTVCARPPAGNATTEDDVQVVFPTGYTLGLAATFTVNTTNLAWPATANAWPGIGTATNVTSQTVTFPSTNLTASTLYCFNWINSAAVQIKSSATSNNLGNVTTRASAVTVDTEQYATASITNDEIVVTATVPSIFSFTLSGNTDALGTLAQGSVTPSPTPRTVTIDTNATNGWMAWAKDSNTGLTSAAASNTIASTTPGTNSTLSAGTEGYNTGVTSSQVGGSGTITVQTPFVGGSLGRGGGLDTGLRTLATSNGTADDAVLTLTNNAAISALTEPATDYTDTITVIGAGQF
jgi:hypothetical protein